jgi:hypothetical protein
MAATVQQVEAIVGHKIFMKTSTEWAPGKWHNKIFVDVTKEQINSLANAKGIYWIEPMLKFKTHNANTQVTMQNGVLTANARVIWAKGINGEGQIIQNLDTGCSEANEYFRDNARRKSTWYWDNSHRKVVGQRAGARADEIELGWHEGSMSKFGDEAANSYHGTHTAGSNCGNDSTILAGTAEGMAKEAKLLFIDGGGDSGSVYGTYDLNRVGAWGWDSTVANGIPRAYISSNSWGSDDSGKYSGSSMEADQFMWSHKDYLWVFANGNTGTAGQPGGKAGSPATCKNGVAVGALASAGAGGLGGANTKATFSSWGRLVDGRLSPTVTAPGVGIISADGDGAGTRTMDGTSMACPIVAGSAALLRQYFTEGWYPTGLKLAANGFIPSAALMKATLAISGDSTTSWCGSFVPDSLFGWGRVNLDTALFFSGNQVKLLLQDNRTGINTGEALEYQVRIPALATGLKISLTWTDYPGATFAAKTLVNDLDLDAYSPAAARYRGNRYGTALPRQSVTTATNNDSIDIIEGIKVVSPAEGTWKIRVTGKNVAMGPQPFALVVTYRTALPAAGKVYLDKPVYAVPTTAGSIDTLRIEVYDMNKTGNCTVFVWSKLAEPKQGTSYPETLILALTGTGLYKGTMPLENSTPITFNNKKLNADQNDTIYVIYNDALPLGVDTAKAVVDASLFTITNVRAGDTQPPVGTMKNVLWTTSRNSTSKVYYGPTTALGSVATVDTPLMVNHAVRLTGLAGNTLYYFDVESRDARGITLRDNNGGRHYSFSTGGGSGQSDILVWMWDDNGYANSFIHADYLTKALQSGGWSYDWWSSQLQGPYKSNDLKKYKAVFIQIAQDGPQGGNYPAFTTSQRDTLKKYHDAGARFAVTGNDIAWDTWANQAAGPDLQADTIFCRNYLHFTYKGDLASNATLTDMVYGAPGDPISGSYTAGIAHVDWRAGASGDTIHLSGSSTPFAGTGSYVWNMDGVFDSCGIKWASTNNIGTLGNGVWGGYPTRVVMNAFEITQLEAANANSAARTDILNKMFIWLIGHDHPYDTIQTPVAGNTYSASPISIAWRSYAKNGAFIDTTWVEYSSNGGNSWNLLTKGNGLTSPYNWDITARENGNQYQVRVRVQDGGVYPAMSGFDTVGNFTINRIGNDFTGPLIMPGTIKMNRNPVGNDAGNGFTVSAVASDSTTGLSPIQAVRCSVVTGSTTKAVVLMSATDGSFNSVQEAVHIEIPSAGWTAGVYTVYLRAQDASTAKSVNNWGVLSSTTFQVAENISTPALSVSLNQFTAMTAEKGVLLNWSTASENGSYKWLIERSLSNSGPFQKIAELPAANQAQEYSYNDLGAVPGQSYFYLLVEVDNLGNRTEFGPVVAQSGGIRMPAIFALQEARPNPFGGTVDISYQLPEQAQVSLKIYNIAGQLVRTADEGLRNPGYYPVSWNGAGDNGKALSNGIYIYRLTATTASGQQYQTARKVTLLK